MSQADIYSTRVLSDELLQCDNLDDLKADILLKLQEQRIAWQWKIEQILRGQFNPQQS